jgi:hypothetical protein
MANLSVAVLRQEAILETPSALNEWLRSREQLWIYREHLAPPKVVRSLLATDQGQESYVTEHLLSQRRMISLERLMVRQMHNGAIAWVKLETAVGASLQLPLTKQLAHAPRVSSP